VDRQGLHGVYLGDLPHGYAGLLNNQVAVHDLTADAILHKSKALALQALLVDPIVSQYDGLEEMLDTMIEYQEKWLGYLK
jgi:alpha-galactosidase